MNKRLLSLLILMLVIMLPMTLWAKDTAELTQGVCSPVCAVKNEVGTTISTFKTFELTKLAHHFVVCRFLRTCVAKNQETKLQATI